MGCLEFCFIVHAIFLCENAQLAHNLTCLSLIKQKEKMPPFQKAGFKHPMRKALIVNRGHFLETAI